MKRANPLNIKREGRSGHDWQWTYMLWCICVGLSAAFVFGVVAGGGCNEAFRYANNHGW